MEIYGFLKNSSTKQPYNKIFHQNMYCHKTDYYNAINTINWFKQLKHALESKLSNFKILKTTSISCHSLTHPLTTTINLPPKLLAYGLRSFPVQSLYPSAWTFQNLMYSYLHTITWHQAYIEKVSLWIKIKPVKDLKTHIDRTLFAYIFYTKRLCCHCTFQESYTIQKQVQGFNITR